MTTRILPPVILFAFFTAHTVACGGAPDNEPTPAAESSETASDKGDAVASDASAATKKELGVTRWSVTSKPDGSVVSGFDAKDKEIVKLESTATEKDETHTTYAFAFHDAKGDAKMKIAIEAHTDDSGVLTMLANDFADRPDAKRALELMQQDFENGSAGSGGLLTTKTLAAETLAPQADSLTTGQCADLIKCGQTKLTRLDADAKSALICAGSALNVGAGVAFDSATGQDVQKGASNRAGDCARAMKYSQEKASESAAACKINCVQL